MIEEIDLCEETGLPVMAGACPIHKGDACLRAYVPKSGPASDHWKAMMDMRGVEHETACPRCIGLGVRSYPNTTGWRGGIGGQAVTSAVCDHCWGSGDKNRKGADLRTMEAHIRNLESKIEALEMNLRSARRDGAL